MKQTTAAKSAAAAFNANRPEAALRGAHCPPRLPAITYLNSIFIANTKLPWVEPHTHATSCAFFANPVPIGKYAAGPHGIATERDHRVGLHRHESMAGWVATAEALHQAGGLCDFRSGHALL